MLWALLGLHCGAWGKHIRMIPGLKPIINADYVLFRLLKFDETWAFFSDGDSFFTCFFNYWVNGRYHGPVLYSLSLVLSYISPLLSNWETKRLAKNMWARESISHSADRRQHSGDWVKSQRQNVNHRTFQGRVSASLSFHG